MRQSSQLTDQDAARRISALASEHKNRSKVRTVILNSTEMNILSQDISYEDVLFGRIPDNYRNTGIRLMKEHIMCHLEEYELSKGKTKRKGRIIDHVMHIVRHNGGRFLKKDPDGLHWREATDKEARSKVSHLFRDIPGTPSFKKWKSEQTTDQVYCSVIFQEPHDQNSFSGSNSDTNNGSASASLDNWDSRDDNEVYLSVEEESVLHDPFEIELSHLDKQGSLDYEQLDDNSLNSLDEIHHGRH